MARFQATPKLGHNLNTKYRHNYSQCRLIGRRGTLYARFQTVQYQNQGRDQRTSKRHDWLLREYIQRKLMRVCGSSKSKAGRIRANSRRNTPVWRQLPCMRGRRRHGIRRVCSRSAGAGCAARAGATEPLRGVCCQRRRREDAARDVRAVPPPHV